MKRQTKFFITAAIIALISVFFTFGISAETVSDHFEYTYNDSVIVCNDWTFDTESGLLTIENVGTHNWNETGTGQSSYDKFGGWSKYNSQIKKVVLIGRFNKISNNAFKGCTSLEEISITDTISQIDHSAFLDCSSLRAIYMGNNMRMDDTADLRNINVLESGILKGTAIKKLFASRNDSFTVEENALPKSLTEIIGVKGSAADTYAKGNGFTFTPIQYDVYVDVIKEGKFFNCLSVAYGSKLINLGSLGNGSALALFSDKECTKAYDNTVHITENTVIYAKELLRFVGFSARSEGYKGLRAIYEFDIDAAERITGLKILKVGGIIGLSEYALNDFTIETDSAHAISVYVNGERVGETLGIPKNGKVRFAITAVGFEAEGDETIERCLENIAFRGFVETYDEATGKNIINYTDAAGTNLRKASITYLESEEGKKLSKDKQSFIGSTITLTAGKGEETRYSKEELMQIITDIYNDNGKLLIGEEIAPNKTANDVIKSYMDASGEAPSIIGMDLACYGIPLMTVNEAYRTEFLKALIDYCRDGGIITASSHFQNPTKNWTSSGLCRGYLGKESLWDDLITEGTQLNREFKRELNVDAAFLRELSNNDVQILWRPFHEMNGSWFWWCIKQENGYLIDARTFHQVWKYVYNYYENELGLKNLIWVYSPNNDTGNLVDVEYCYPGDEYVDMVGLDWYSSGKYEIGSSERAYLRMMDYGMPTALTEYGGTNGELDSIETWEDIQKMYKDGMKIVYVLTWTGSHTFHQAGKCDELMAKPDTLNVNEVYAMFKALEK